MEFIADVKKEHYAGKTQDIEKYSNKTRDQTEEAFNEGEQSKTGYSLIGGKSINATKYGKMVRAILLEVNKGFNSNKPIIIFGITNSVRRLDRATEEAAWNILAVIGIPPISGGWNDDGIYWNDIGFATQIDDPEKIQDLMLKYRQRSIMVIDNDGKCTFIKRVKW